MPSRVSVSLLACGLLAGCVGDGSSARLPDPRYGGAASNGGYPRDYPQGAVPPPGAPAPLGAGEAEAAPQDARDPRDAAPVKGMRIVPPTTGGPSATSGNGTPSDRYDEVGYATWYGEELGADARTSSGAPFDPNGFTAAHRTLPLGAFVEVTALDTGRTILVQVNDRGPSQRTLLIDLSRGAAQALGITARAGVRVRRVTPTPSDLAALRQGQPGAPRLDTPAGLLAALRQRLPSGAGPSPAAQLPSRPAYRATPTPPPASGSGATPVREGYFVQVAAFSSRDRAAALARALSGTVSGGNGIWRVRTGPYANAGQAAQARDAIARRGYGDARVVSGD